MRLAVPNPFRGERCLSRTRFVILEDSMRVLFAISILCLSVLLWAAVSIVRHAQTTRRRRRGIQPPQTPFYEVLFEGKRQQIRDHTAIAAAQKLPTPISRPIEALTLIAEMPTAKKTSQPVVFSREHQLLDWDHFNKGLGDHSDPCQPKTDVRNGTRN